MTNKFIYVPEDWVIIAEVYELFSSELKGSYKADLDRIFWCDSYQEIGPPSYLAFKLNYRGVIYSLHPNSLSADAASQVKKFMDQFPTFPYVPIPSGSSLAQLGLSAFAPCGRSG